MCTTSRGTGCCFIPFFILNSASCLLKEDIIRRMPSMCVNFKIYEDDLTLGGGTTGEYIEHAS